jgi:hypothetical protein
MRVGVPYSIASILLPITFMFPVPYPSNMPLCSFASDGDGEARGGGVLWSQIGFHEEREGIGG